MSGRSLLRVESLESRDTPAAFGTAWPDGQHLTLSFAPDSTAIDGSSSTLGTLGAAARLPILTAFQTWAVQAGLNIGLVGDDGSLFGTGGSVQGDPRFGDIRVGGLNLPSDILAATAPYNLFDNYSGDVVVNTSSFRLGGPDLYTVLLQEAGHALSIGNSPDPASVMYEYYQGARIGLAPSDIDSVQALYGARPADQYEGAFGNGTLATATRYSSPVTADLTTTGDVDVYRFNGALLASGATISLHARGISLVTARVEVLNSRGQVLTSTTVTDPTNNDVTLSLNSVQFGATYYVRVSSGRSDVFGVGAYQLDIKQQTFLGGVLGAVGGLLDDTGLNDTLLSATRLLTGANTVDASTEYNTDGNFGSASDVDDYRIIVPPTSDGSAVNLLTTVWGKNGSTLSPWVTVYDAFGHRMAAEVLTADGKTTTMQVRGLAPGGVYFLSLSSDVHATGGYHLSADLRLNPVSVPHGGTGTLTAQAPVAEATFTLPQTDQVHLVLSASGAGSGMVELIVIAPDGSVAAEIETRVGRGGSVDVFLPAGRYRIEVRSTDLSSPIDYQVGFAVETDPAGATPTDPTSNPDGSPPPPPPPPPPSDPALQPADPDPDDAWWY
jgi:hypothetical protein